MIETDTTNLTNTAFKLSHNLNLLKVNQYLNFVLKKENIYNKIKDFRTEFVILDNPSTLRSGKTNKIYSVYLEFENNTLEINFPLSDLSSAIFIIFHEIEVILTEKSVLAVEYNNLTNHEISIEWLIINAKEQNKIKIFFSGSVEEEAEMILGIKDKFTYGTRFN
jgi:hypothetical protein